MDELPMDHLGEPLSEVAQRRLQVSQAPISKWSPRKAVAG